MVSIEIRKLMVKNRRKGMTIKKIAEVFDVCEMTVIRILKREAETGSVEPSYEGCGRNSEMTPEKLEELKKLVNEQPDITLEEIRETMNLSMKKSQISNILRNKLGFRFKKKRYMLQNGIGKM